MPRYATLGAADAEARYRQIDLAGRTGGNDAHGLVGLLYEELLAALRSAAWAAEHRQYRVRADKVTRATAILFALEAGLDFANGGPLAETLAKLYAGARAEVVQASIGDDPAPFLDVAGSLGEIAGAWASIRA